MEKIVKSGSPSEIQQNLMKDAKEITDKVLIRIEDSASKYGASFTLADIEKEFEAEVLDIVGWPLLQAVRIQQLMKKRLKELNDDYLKKFLQYHDKEYLLYLRDQINEELVAREESGI